MKSKRELRTERQQELWGDLLAAGKVAPARPAKPGFDPAHHPCVICGAEHAPFGLGPPAAPSLRFFCRKHWEEFGP